ncbi:MAG: hypothetical protein M0Z46_00555 [Actinomycetota bacterium]|jgi:hypothetical protein|nr:hypothetical protein [Actinomycetota bacterium]
METVAGGETAIEALRASRGSLRSQTDVCDACTEVITLKSRTVWFPVLHKRGFL